MPEGHGDGQEQDGAEDNPRDGEAGDLCPSGGRRGHQAAHHRQDHQPQDVVQNRRAEDDLPLRGVRHAEILQHAGGDPHASGRQRRADEQVDQG